MSAVEAAGVAPVPPKVDPETLVLRARPARAIRFRKGAVIGIAALGSAGLMGVAWMALKPQLFRQVATSSELSEPMAKPASDALGKLPNGYGDVPKLGPPLPGDLGRPILRAQQQMVPSDAAAPRPTGVDAAEAERLARLAQLKAGRESALMVQLQGSGRGAPSPAGMDAPAQPVAGAPPAEPVVDRRTAFVEKLDTSGTVNPHALAPPMSPYMLGAGSVIAASLVTGINSDLPGMIVAQVTQNVFDTVSGRHLLVPQGARLIGKYDSAVAFGQRRALVIWQRIMLPDGSSLTLDNMPATDAAGFAGLADKVDFHTWTLLKGIAMATLLGVGTELSVSGESDLVEAIRESAQSNTARAGDRITQRNLDIPPSITIRPGAPVRLLVNRDLILAPWRGMAGN